ncbi:MAG: hypothetical protein C0467_30005 [Planctomycetaceae bacterium]|nr:hypothetical protein [Planctomycetaceae bacterium]
MGDDTLVRESFDFSGGAVDEGGPYPVIKGVLICGLTSKHGYDYLPSAWSDEDLKRYEGISSYEGHKDGPRLPSEKVGWFQNVRRRPDGRPEGDYVLEPDHQMTPRVIRAAKHNPKGFMLSHQANVKWGMKDGRRVVEGFKNIHSVDLVGDGGTTGGIFESAPGSKAVTIKVSDYATKLAPKLSLEQLVKLKTLVKEDGGDAPMMPDAPPADGAETSGDDGIDSAFLSAGMAALKECIGNPGDKAKVKACAKKLVKLLMAHGDIKGDVEVDDATPPAAKKDEPPTTESAPEPWALRDEFVRESGFEPTSIQIDAMRGLTPEKRKAFVREQKGLANATTPASRSREQIAAADLASGLVKEHGHGSAADDIAAGIARARKNAAENQGVKSN